MTVKIERNIMELIAEFLGYLGGICIAFAFFPQTIHTIRNRDVKGLSLSTYIIYCTGIISWILYGIYLKSIQMIFFNTISLIFSVIILFLIICNKQK